MSEQVTKTEAHDAVPVKGPLQSDKGCVASGKGEYSIRGQISWLVKRQKNATITSIYTELGHDGSAKYLVAPTVKGNSNF